MRVGGYCQQQRNTKVIVKWLLLYQSILQSADFFIRVYQSYNAFSPFLADFSWAKMMRGI